MKQSYNSALIDIDEVGTIHDIRNLEIYLSTLHSQGDLEYCELTTLRERLVEKNMEVSE